MFTHPSVTLVSADFTREDLFLVVYTMVDDWLQARYGASNAPRARRGPRVDEFSDAEVLCIVLVGELCHCPREKAWLRQVRASYGPLFPHLPEDSRFSRRIGLVRRLLAQLRETLLRWADADIERYRILDSFPMPLCACYRILQSSLPISGATFGYNQAKCRFYHGLRPQLLITFSGFIVDLALFPGNRNDQPALAAYLDECVEQGRILAGQVWVLDKGYGKQALVALAKEKLGLTLLVRKRDKGGETPSSWQLTLDRVRKPIEAVLSVLTECFGIEHPLAKTDIGLYRRVQAKATAFTLARYFNEALGLQPMNIARYAV
jgi:hypothetical protein